MAVQAHKKLQSRVTYKCAATRAEQACATSREVTSARIPVLVLGRHDRNVSCRDIVEWAGSCQSRLGQTWGRARGGVPGHVQSTESPITARTVRPATSPTKCGARRSDL